MRVPGMKRPYIRGARIAGVVLLVLLAVAWITSLPFAPFLSDKPSDAQGTDKDLIADVTSPPGWGDTLILRLTVGDLGVQQRHGFVVWLSDGKPYQYPVVLLADGRAHRLVIPVGTRPEWRGSIRAVRFQLPPLTGLDPSIGDVQFVKRPPWAVDALLGRSLAPYLPYAPPFPNVLLLTAVLLGGAITLLLPFGTWRRRFTISGSVLGLVVGTAVVVSQMSLLAVLFPAYAGLDEASAAMRVPAYDESSQNNVALVAAASQLPDGPVLLVGLSSARYVAYRAEYSFYPRRVDAVNARPTPDQLLQWLQGGYVGLIEPSGENVPPPVGWQELDDRRSPISIWRAPGLTPLQPPEVASDAPILLILGLAVVLGAGWIAASVLGLGGAARLFAAWVLGVGAITWWMFLLSIAGITWSWWSIGLPFLIAAAIFLYRRTTKQGWKRPAPPHARHLNAVASRLLGEFAGARARHTELMLGVLVLALLVAGVTVQALLLPFNDYDTWANWGLKGKAFYLDGNIARVLTMYNEGNLHHPDYPPAQPLLEAWGYLTMSGIGERLVKVIFPIWYAACLGLVWSLCRQWSTRRGALAWTLLLATTPLLLDHATLGNADLALAVALLLGALFLTRWIESGARHLLVGAVIALGGGAWIKLDGTYVGGAMLVFATLARALSTRQQPRQFRTTFLAALGALVAFVLIIAPWSLFTHRLELQADASLLQLLAHVRPATLWRAVAELVEELALSHSNAAWGLLGGGYGAFWIISAGAVVVNARKLRPAVKPDGGGSGDPVLWFLLLSIGGGIAFYLAIYTLRPFFSMERYLLHLAPLAVVAASRSQARLHFRQAP
jgi:hypothetical protein